MLDKARKFIGNLINDEFLLGEGKKQRRTNLTLTAGFMILVSLVLFAIFLIRNDFIDVAGAGGTILVNLLVLFFLHRVKAQELALYIFAMGMLATAWFLLLFGSSQLYSALWVLAYPMVFCLFFGNAFARPYLTLMLASMLLFFSPLFDSWRLNTYSADFKMQLPFMFVTFSFLCMFAEYIRSRTSQRLLFMYKHYYESANRDQLTGLLNRRAFYDMIGREQARARRHHIGLQLVMSDIDHFKRINDRYGHQYGDRYLLHIARILVGQLRGEDYCFRWGGEEFLLVLPNTSPPQAKRAAGRLLETVRATPLYDEQVGEIATTMSFGVHAFALGMSADENIARCDKCLYTAKRNGRDRVEQGSVLSGCENELISP